MLKICGRNSDIKADVRRKTADKKWVKESFLGNFSIFSDQTTRDKMILLTKTGGPACSLALNLDLQPLAHYTKEEGLWGILMGKP